MRYEGDDSPAPDDGIVELDAPPEIPDDAIEISAETPWWRTFYVRIVAGALAGLAAASVYHFQIQGAAPPIPNTLMWGCPAAGIAIALLTPLPPFVRGAVLWDEGLMVIGSNRTALTMSPESIGMIAGRTGISLDGGEIIAPRAISVLTAAGPFSMRFHPADAQKVYELLTVRLKGAASIGFNGDAHIPERPAELSRQEFAELIRCFIHDEFKQRARKAAIGAIVSFVAGAGLLAAGVASMSTNAANGSAKAVVFGIIGLVMSLALAGSVFRSWRAGVKAMVMATAQLGDIP